MGTVFLQLCLQFSLIMLLLTVVALLASGCLGEVVLPQGHVMAGRMPYNNPFFHYNGFNNGMINHHLLRSSHHVVDPGFGMVNTMPFRAGHPMGHIMGHPFQMKDLKTCLILKPCRQILLLPDDFLTSHVSVFLFAIHLTQPVTSHSTIHHHSIHDELCKYSIANEQSTQYNFQNHVVQLKAL